MCLKLSSLYPKVSCWLYGVRLGCALGWFVGPKFSLWDGLDWVGLKKMDPRTTLVCGVEYVSGKTIEQFQYTLLRWYGPGRQVLRCKYNGTPSWTTEKHGNVRQYCKPNEYRLLLLHILPRCSYASEVFLWASVRLSARLSVCQTRGLWQNEST